MKLINQNLSDLFAGREIRIPYYDFRTGKSIPDHTPMKLGEKEIVLIDSLHGLYPEMTEDVPNEWKFKLYRTLAPVEGQPRALRPLDRCSTDAPHAARCLPQGV